MLVMTVWHFGSLEKVEGDANLESRVFGDVHAIGLCRSKIPIENTFGSTNKCYITI